MSTLNPPTVPLPPSMQCPGCSYDLSGLGDASKCPECGKDIAPSVAAGRRCCKCAYELTGLPMSGSCPECGTPVEASLRGFVLEYAHPDYLKKLKSGLEYVLNGILCSVVLIVLAAAVPFLLASLRSPSMSAFQMISQGLQFLVTMIILFGYFKYTEPDPSYTGFEKPNSARTVLRIAIAVQAGCVAVQLLLTAVLLNTGGAGMTSLFSILLLGGLGLVSLAASATQYFAAIRYTRWLASRVPDDYVVRRTKTYMWLLPVLVTVGALVLIGPLIALIMYWNLLHRMRKHIKSILETGTPSAIPNRLG